MRLFVPMVMGTMLVQNTHSETLSQWFKEVKRSEIQDRTAFNITHEPSALLSQGGGSDSMEREISALSTERGISHEEAQLKEKDPAMLVEEQDRAKKAKVLAKYLAINANMGLSKYVTASADEAAAKTKSKEADPKQKPDGSLKEALDRKTEEAALQQKIQAFNKMNGISQFSSGASGSQVSMPRAKKLAQLQKKLGIKEEKIRMNKLLGLDKYSSESAERKHHNRHEKQLPARIDAHFERQIRRFNAEEAPEFTKKRREDRAKLAKLRKELEIEKRRTEERAKERRKQAAELAREHGRERAQQRAANKQYEEVESQQINEELGLKELTPTLFPTARPTSQSNIRTTAPTKAPTVGGYVDPCAAVDDKYSMKYRVS
jgi:hypothetical protein